MDDAVSDLVKDINKLRLDLGDTRSKGESCNEELLGKLSFMRRLVEELREKTWELDTNTRNNLVIYGIKRRATRATPSGQSRRQDNYSIYKVLHGFSVSVGCYFPSVLIVSHNSISDLYSIRKR